tara:strand:- start:1596 stop:1949 length:354 start_codon:yes stop_codon:yes gene_type:complete
MNYKEIPMNKIKGIRKSLNILSMQNMGEKIKNQSYMPPSNLVQPEPKVSNPQFTQQNDKPIIRDSGNTNREISRPLGLFSQPLSMNRIAKTKEAEIYKKNKHSQLMQSINNLQTKII